MWRWFNSQTRKGSRVASYKRIHGQIFFYLEGDGGGYDDGGGYNDDDADDDNGDGGGYIQLTIMIATCRSHRGFCAGFAV